MASLVLGAAGAVVGSFFGMPGLGFMIGSALGSALEPKKGQDGPRLTDLHNQNSQFGLAIPIAYGTVRIAGNVIWLPEKEEHTHHNSGKGGQGPASYTYTQSMGIQICEGPILGIQRIWANKRLVWDARISDNSDFPFTLYLGTTTQLPHPAYEADKGVGNVSAHRGYACVFIDDMQLEPFGNAPPSLEFEVIAQQNAKISRVNTWEPDVPSLGGAAVGYLRGIEHDGSNIFISAYVPTPLNFAPMDFTKDKYTYDGVFVENSITVGPVATTNPLGDFRFDIRGCANASAAMITSHDPSNTSIQNFWFVDGLQTSPEVFGPPGWIGFVVEGNPAYANDKIYATGGSLAGPGGYVAKWDAPDRVPNGTMDAYYYFAANAPSPGNGADVAVGDDGTVWVMGTPSFGTVAPLWHFDADLNLITFWAEATTGISHVAGQEGFTVYNSFMVFRDTTTLHLYSINDDLTFTLVDSLSDTDVFAGGTIDLGGGYFLTNDGVFQMNSPITLKYYVDSLSEKAGLVSGQYFTDTLTQQLHGIVIAQQSDIRSCLEPALTWFDVDAVESGPLIKFVNRGAAPDENIPDDDLAAFIEGEDCPALIESTRIQETDLPRRVTVSYFDKDADYQIGSQHEKREVTYSNAEQSLAFPIVATASEGKEKAGIILYDTWAKRRKISFSTSRKWSKLEPTDVKTAGGYTFVITKRDEGQAGVLKFDAVATRAQIFASHAVGAPSIGFTPPVPPHIQSTQLLLLDLPLIQDGDYSNGHYAAMAGAASSSWGSAVLEKSTDGGTTYNSLLTNSVADVIGLTTTVLGNFLGGNAFDVINSVTVTIGLGGGTLASASQLAVLNGANEALVGSEIIQFTTATLIATRTYTLTGLLRGRRGTSWAMASHTTPENFVVLPTSTNVNAPFAELGLTRKYKAVSAGQTLADATAVDFTNTGIALEPYAPVHLGGGRDASGNITINWQRCTRIGGAWLDFVDSPLSEAAEQYEVRIYTDGTYTSSYNAYIATAQTYAYSAADQTSDSGGLLSPLYVGVSQLGAYGYGYEVRGTI